MINRCPFLGVGGSVFSPINSVSDSVKTFGYCDRAIYENKVLTTLLIEGSYVSFTKYGSVTNAMFTLTYHFYMKDHLGDVRQVTRASSSTWRESWGRF